MRHISQIKQCMCFMKFFMHLMFFMVIFESCAHRGNEKISALQVDMDYSYYSNGQMEFSAEYINGKLDGLSKHWSESGNLISETQYKNGKLHGFWKKYYSNQNILYETHYFHGQKHGKEKWYYENGQIKSEQTFQYGTPENDMMRWRPNGSILY